MEFRSEYVILSPAEAELLCAETPIHIEDIDLVTAEAALVDECRAINDVVRDQENLSPVAKSALQNKKYKYARDRTAFLALREPIVEYRLELARARGDLSQESPF